MKLGKQYDLLEKKGSKKKWESFIKGLNKRNREISMNDEEITITYTIEKKSKGGKNEKENTKKD